MSAPLTMGCLGLSEKVAAMSLCAMGRMTVKGQVNGNCPRPISPSSSSRTDLREPNVAEDCQSQTPGRSDNVGNQRRTKGKPPPVKRFRKSRETKRNPAVSYDEMKRLMRVYGPTKCLRNRTPEESGKRTKILSVKRKFYRWFPDFHERFELQTPGEWYSPKVGHEREMEFREELRREDQALLVKKRNARRHQLLQGHITRFNGA